MAEVGKDQQSQAFEGDLELSADQMSGVVGGRTASDSKATKRKKKATRTQAAAKATTTPTLTDATRNKLVGN